MTDLYDDYILWYLFVSAIILVYLTTFIKPEIEKMEEQNKQNKDNKEKLKVDPYFPFYINSPLTSPILSYSNHSYLFKNNTV